MNLGELRGGEAVFNLVTADVPVSEAARAMAEVVIRNLSPRAHEHLHLLLGAKRTFTAPAAARRRRLAVILDLMHAQRRRPSLKLYIAEYERRTEAGEDVPSPAQLYTWFGTWPNALAVAARYSQAGTGARAPSRAPRSRRPRGSVTEGMLLRSIEALHEELGHWPSDIEYFAVLNAEKLLRSKLGVGDVEMFSVTAFNATFGSYGEGVKAAQRRYTARGRGREGGGALPPSATLATPRAGRPRRDRTRSANLRGPA